MGEWREAGTIVDADSRAIVVGVKDGRVTLRTLGTRDGSEVKLDVQCAEDFAQVFLSACWQAAQQLAAKARA